MIGVLIKDAGAVVDKRTYAGDPEKITALVDALSIQNQGKTVEVHNSADLDWKTTFVEVSFVPPLRQEQKDWLLAKAAGTPASLAFLAKWLGLE